MSLGTHLWVWSSAYLQQCIRKVVSFSWLSGIAYFTMVKTSLFFNMSMCDLFVIFTLLDFSIPYFYFWHGTCLVWGRSLLGILQSIVIWTEGQNEVSFWANKTRLSVLKLANKQRQTHMNEKCRWDGSSIRRWNEHSLEVCDEEVPPTWWALFVCQQQVQVLVIGIRETRYSRFAQVAALATGKTGKHWHYPAVVCLWLTNLVADRTECGR